MTKTDYTLTIAKQTISTLPIASFTGEITVVETPEQASKAVAYLRNCDIIGFDTETKPSFKKGNPNKVALMQLSTESHCFLFRLNLIGLTDDIVRLIEDANVMKIGLSVRDDFHVMHRSSDVNPQGFLELQEYVKQFKIADISLQKIYAILFGEKISKNQRLTNWEATTLTRPQQVYAATDAWACLRIYKLLSSGGFNPLASPYLTYPQEDASEDASNELEK